MPGAHVRVFGTVDELEQLHGELDVGERTAPELEMELRILTGRDPLALDARLHATDLAHVVVSHGLPVGELGRDRCEARAELGVAGNEARLGERLAFPRESPLRVVLAEPADRSRQRPLVALRSQARVDAERLTLCGRGADLLHELRGDLFGVAEGVGAVAVVHEHHVDVGRVRQLRPAEPTEADDRERQRGPERRERRFEARLGESGELALGGLESRVAEEVACCDAQQLAPLEPAQPLTSLLLVAAPFEGVERVADEIGAGCLDVQGVVVVEHVDELRMASHRIADDPARSEEVTGPLGGSRMITEGDRERRGPGGPFGQASELEQAEVGIGGLRQPAEDHREELTHHTRAAGQTGGELAHRGPRALDVGEPERGQAFLRRLGRQRTGAREGLEQRREEQPFVDAAHRELVLAVLGLEAFQRGAFRAVAVAEHTREPHPRVRVGGDQVSLLLVVELEAVLDGAEELIGAIESVGVGALDVAAVGELVQRVEGGGRPHGGVVTTVHELQQLHGELDVADATATTLELAVADALALGALLGALLHGPDLADGVGVELLGPHPRRGDGHEPLTELEVAGDRSCLHQRLELPVARPLVVVGGVTGKRSRERALTAFGSEVGVGAEDDAVLTRRRHGGKHRARGALGEVGVALVHEQDVDVARVVELASTELPHADDGHGHRRIHQLECALHAHPGQLGQLPADRGHVGDAEEVSHRGPQELTPLPPPQPAGIVGCEGLPERTVGLACPFTVDLVGIAQRVEQ